MSDTVTAEVTTASVVQDMLTENTGRHFLDSGDSYGRHWQRNQGRTFADEPEATLSWKWDGVTVSTYHFLVERLTYEPAGDAAFLAWGEANDDPWLVNAEEWVGIIGGRGPYGDGGPMVVNTYNGEDALSQTLQYVLFALEDDTALPLPGQTYTPEPVTRCAYCGVTVQPSSNGHLLEDAEGSTVCTGTGSGGEHEEGDPTYDGDVTVLSGGTYVLLQIHGGADVRGGYTKPRLFSLGQYEESALFDNARVTLYCSNNACRDEYGQGTRWDSDNAGYSWQSESGADLESYDRHDVDLTDEAEAVHPLLGDLREPANRVGQLVIDAATDTGYCPVCGVGTLQVAPWPAG